MAKNLKKNSQNFEKITILEKIAKILQNKIIAKLNKISQKMKNSQNEKKN